MSCLVACSGSDSDAELRAKIADLEEELEEQQIASNDLDSESTTTDAEPEGITEFYGVPQVVWRMHFDKFKEL